MSRATVIRLLFAALAVGFFAMPAAARVVGVTAEAIENRPFAEKPELSQGWDAFQQTGRFLTDRMPLRAQAVRANTRIWTDVFGATPRYGSQNSLAADQALPFGPEQGADSAGRTPREKAAEVYAGEDGWLFVGEEQERACSPSVPFDRALERWERLVADIRSLGKRAWLVVPPDKGTIYPEHVGDNPLAKCSAEGKARFWSLLERAGEGSGVVSLRDELLRRKARAGNDLYHLKDSHWTTLGSLTMVRAVLDRFGDGIRLRSGEIVDPGPAEHTGDLTYLLGAPEAVVHERRNIVRTADAPLVPGRTLVIADSFFEAPHAQVAAYFADFHHVSWDLSPMPLIAQQIELADNVIIETVERKFTLRARGDDRLEQLEAARRARSNPRRDR